MPTLSKSNVTPSSSPPANAGTPPSSAASGAAGVSSPTPPITPAGTSQSSVSSANPSGSAPPAPPFPLKPSTTVQQQIQLLKSRNCIINNVAFAENVLNQVTYYHLSAYFLPFRQKGGSYVPGTTFEKVYSVFEFDQKLRNILFSIIEKIELYLRREFANYHGDKYGPDGYLNVKNFGNAQNHAIFLQKANDAIKNHSTNPVVQHHNTKYGGVMPIWTLFEFVTFGTLTRFYVSLPAKDQKKLALNMYNCLPTHMHSWLKCCNDLRNDCAHASRLYFKTRLSVPLSSNQTPAFGNTLYDAIGVLKILYPQKDLWNIDAFLPIASLVEGYKKDITLSHIGFPQNWLDDLHN